MTFGTYSGFAVNAVDAKNRLSIPADYRAVIEAKSSARTVVLAPHHRSLPCLVGYDPGRFTKLVERLETKYGVDDGEEREDETRRLIGMAAQVPFDESGRIILSADLRDLGGIDKLVAFVGMGDYFEVWDPETLLATKKDDPLIVRVVTRKLEARA